MPAQERELAAKRRQAEEDLRWEQEAAAYKPFGRCVRAVCVYAMC
jgi:hypothetical protein